MKRAKPTRLIQLSLSAYEQEQVLIQLLQAWHQARVDFANQQNKRFQAYKSYHSAEHALLALEEKIFDLLRRYSSLEKLALTSGFDKHQSQPPKLIIYDESAVPEEFAVLHRFVDREKLLKILLSGQTVPGAHLELTGLTRNDAMRGETFNKKRSL